MGKSPQDPICPDDGNSHRTCRRDKVRDAVVARILDGTYPPGTHLKEMALAEEFAISQAPVREALRELEMLGLVECQRYRGTRVLSPQCADLREAYELKAIIECRAAELAAPCRAEDLDSLEDCLRKMRVAADHADFEAYSVAVLAFHRQLVVMSGNRMFLRAWEALHWEVRSRIATQRARCKLPSYVESHLEVLAALRRGDGALAGQLLREMIERFLEADSPVTKGRGAL